MRKNVARVASTLVLAAAFGLAGCKASVKVGGGDEPPPPPPPAPPAKEEPPPPPAPKPKPKFGGFKFKMKGEQLELPGPVVFETGSAKLKPESDAVLEIVQKYLEQTPKVTLLRIEGHTDDVGDDAKNMQLSKDRAMSVSQWLVAKGTDCKRLLPVGFGETKPIADNATDEGKSQNRRTSFFNAALEGKPIGGMPVDGGGQAAGDPCAKK
ncbi:MAG: OmpA family protein [Deltaproteobacteria bacterium]|nr:OmpA family protein [Deltaproteobacteria bacterium]